MAARNLTVFLNETEVGVLTQFPDGRSFLAFGETYLEHRNRPTLSLSYKNVLSDLRANVEPPYMGLPPFFSNLLPEGKLRGYLAHKAGVKETQEYRLLAALKDDLPGAVLLKPLGAGGTEEEEPERAPESPDDGPLRFSIAGVQMKFSGDLRDSKVVIPASGVGGHWIVKLPSRGYPRVNELEFSMLTLAQEIGIETPEFRLVPVSKLENIPHDLPDHLDGDCLISRRFDRTANGGRIHMEDFAQVFAIQDKYNPNYNYQSIAHVLWIEIGLDAVLEFVRRLVHMIFIGNADMHLKNWSLIYPDGRKPEIAPAYDYVSTVVYPEIDPTLPHKLAGVKEMHKVDLETFKKFAQIAKLPERAVIKTVQETADAIKEAWPRLSPEMPLSKPYKDLIDQHMRRLALSQTRLPS